MGAREELNGMLDRVYEMPWCEHMVKKRDGAFTYREACDSKATFHYRSASGIVVSLCRRHANAAAHRWKNPRPISEVV